MTRVTVVNVKGLRGDARLGVCYVGRQWAGWPRTEWGNHRKHACPGEFRDHLTRVLPDLEGYLARLWEACRRGELPLGCWCSPWDGVGETPACHAAVLAELLNARFADGVPS